jgi:hypothetical protein
MKWVKDPSKRTPTQTTAHLLVSLANPTSANRLITEGVKVCNQRVSAFKDKKEPFTCSTCRNHGHTAREKERCPMQKDLKEGEPPKYRCSYCPGNHESKTCTERDKTFCCNCNTHTHNSFDRRCPTFLKRCEEYNARCPENVLPYFPTDEPYTWSFLPINTPRNNTLTTPMPRPPPTGHIGKRQTTLPYVKQTQPQPTAVQPIRTQAHPPSTRQPLQSQAQAFHDNSRSNSPPDY